MYPKYPCIQNKGFMFLFIFVSTFPCSSMETMIPCDLEKLNLKKQKNLIRRCIQKGKKIGIKHS
jgi:hypothetical protein